MSIFGDDAYVEFEPDTTDAFRGLVQQTLEESEFIETERIGEQIAVREVSDE